MDAQDAIEQALVAAPELRATVGSLHDPEDTASRLMAALRRQLLATSRGAARETR